ncbi:MAG: class I SAM-dependent methyltransferase [Candidatus Kerfeldbacteria bacterium]
MKEDIAKSIMEKNRLGYDQTADHFSSTRKFPWHDFEFFNEYVKNGDNVLDAGCGNGRLFEFFKEKGINYSGLDSSNSLIQIASKSYPTANFQTGDITTLPFSDNKFNTIFCIATLHHIPSKKLRLQTINEFYRVLKPGGYLIMTNWNLLNTKWWPTIAKFSLDKIIGNNNLDWKDVSKPWKNSQGQVQAERFLHAFTKNEISGLLKKNNLKTIKQFYTKKDITSNMLSGFNLITIAKKS